MSSGRIEDMRPFIEDVKVKVALLYLRFSFVHMDPV
jgi:hypothetical protein